MKFAAGIVASGLAVLATASSPSSAAIYELNSPVPSDPPLEVSPREAQLGLALALGISRFYKLGVQTTDDKIEVLERLGQLENRIGILPEDEGRFLLSLAGVGTEGADGLPLNQPVMVMKDAPSAHNTAQLLKQLAKQKAESISQSLQEIAALDSSFCIATPNIGDAESLVSRYKFANYKSWQIGEENKGVTRDMVVVFNPDRNEDRHFMSEYLLFKAFVEKIAPRLNEEKGFAFCHFQGLKDLILAYGQDSTEANLALSLYYNALARLSRPDNIKTTLLLTPGTSDASIGFEIASHLQKRVALEETPFVTEDLQLKPSISSQRSSTNRFQRCYPSKDVCTNVTNTCSSHGNCIEAAKNCWSCACQPTVKKTENGLNSTTNWAGYGCQKKDISVPFNIFFLFTVSIVLVIGWAIRLLYSIGDVPLPNVLSAGVTPTKRS